MSIILDNDILHCLLRSYRSTAVQYHRHFLKGLFREKKAARLVQFHFFVFVYSPFPLLFTSLLVFLLTVYEVQPAFAN
jgi:hypothetical protein